ncbi:MAG: caspase family protein [Ferruginibacter sp.]
MASLRRATVVGINYYKSINRLYGCVQDAKTVAAILERHGNGDKNFDVELLTAEDIKTGITRKKLKNEVSDLFSRKYEIALFYFAGHGYIDSTGGFLLTTDCNDGDDGLSMTELMTLVNESPASSKIVVLDCCHSGYMGMARTADTRAALNEGVTILTASDKDQYAKEENGSGLFTNLFVDALNGAAANLLGEITPGSVYAHIDQSLSAKQQRPLFKTNVESFTSIRKVNSPISIEDLQEIIGLFPTADSFFNLDPSYEPESSNPDPNNTSKFAILQKYNRVNLVVPVGALHMYHAAMESQGCELTVLGRHYWSLVKKDRI